VFAINEENKIAARAA